MDKGLVWKQETSTSYVALGGVPCRGGSTPCVHFLETLHALAGRVAGTELPLSEEFRIHDKLVKRLPRDTAPAKYMVGSSGQHTRHAAAS
jgi:hypothetical protein